MPNPDTAGLKPGRTGPPWAAEGTVYFYGGPLSNFAPTHGLRLPSGYHGHHEQDRVPVASVEHWFQACKATSRQQFDLILACGSAAAAKQSGRKTELRADWEWVKFQVMLC
ncbi:MAG: NADAR family protein [Solirubrobacteraceae bacterium]